MRARGIYPTQGFTLIEVMVVIVIIGLLSAMATSSFLVYRTKSRIVAAVSTSSAIRSAMAAYAVSNPSTLYPVSIADYGELVSVINEHGGQLPPTPDNLGIAFRQYTPIDNSGDGEYESYTMSFRIRNVPTTQRGWCIVISLSAIARCDPI